MLLNIPQESDDGLFYVRVWQTGATVETKFDSLKAATEFVAGLYKKKNYTRIEFLQAREWGTRTGNLAEMVPETLPAT